MDRIKNWVGNPGKRRELLAIGSGGLILLAVGARQIFGLSALRDGLMVAAALLAGGDIAVRAWRSLLNKHISIELLVTIASAGAIVVGEYWEAAAVTFLFVLGAYLETRTLTRTRRVLQDLLELTPPIALVLRGGEQVEVMPHEVAQGETVLVKPGGKMPVDGEVIGGHSVVDESAITGESIPEEKGEGDEVYAGTVNQAGLLKVRATGVGSDTTLARIIRRVEEAQEEKAPTQRFIERFARWYTPSIIGLSVIAFLITRDLELALTLLVIGCPGALVISTPISVVAGIGRAAKSGVLIKGGEYLENAGKISALALDKTGTLTAGQPRLTDVIALAPEPVTVGFADVITEGRWLPDQQRVIHWAALAEIGSEHPLAAAITAEVNNIPQADSFDTCTGRGVTASFRGHTIGVGTLALMDRMRVKVPAEAEQHLERLKDAGKTAVLVSLDSEVLGVLGIADTIRDTAREMVRRLTDAGLERIVMLTGDDQRTAHAIARQAGINDVRAELLPENKLEVIHQLQEDGHVVAMVGDGINDAPALAAADIGIAMGAAGTDVAIETADIALMADDLLKLPEAIRLSKATLRNIRQNVLVALVTVSALLVGVLLGEVHMAGGMLIHEASVLIVTVNGMRLLRM